MGAFDYRLGTELNVTLVAVLKDLKEGRITGEHVPKSVIAVAKVAEEQMGGTSGAIYSCVLSHPALSGS